MYLLLALTFPFVVAALMALFLLRALRSASKIKKEIDASGLPQNTLQKNLTFDRHIVRSHYTPAHNDGKRRSPSRLTFTIDGCFASSLFLSKELRGDRLLRAIGLSQETETGDPDLDALFHIVAEDSKAAVRWM